MLRVLLLFLLSVNAYATPQKVELWFLSIDKTSWLDSIIKKPYVYYSYVAGKSLQCQQMGEYCFDPQVGLYKRGQEGEVQQEIDMAEIENNTKYDFMETPKGIDRDLVACEKGGDFFSNIFCGKKNAKQEKSKINLQVWVDTSSTMRQVDYKGFGDTCEREIFLSNLAQTCPLNQKMKVYFFDEFRKEAGNFQPVCVADGLNNMKRIISDIKASKVKNLIIITDIFEAESSFINAIKMTGVAKIKGLEKPLYAKDIQKELRRVRKLCL